MTSWSLILLVSGSLFFAVLEMGRPLPPALLGDLDAVEPLIYLPDALGLSVLVVFVSTRVCWGTVL